MVQHNLNQELPYASVLDAERDDAFNLAVTGLRQALTTGDLQRAARFHTAAIRRALALKHRLADETLTSLIYLLFELVTAPVTVALPVHTRWCGLLVKLLKSGKHLALTLPWRRLFEMLVSHAPKLRLASYASRGVQSAHAAALARVAAQARRHFPAGTAAALLEALEPLLCPHGVKFFVGCALFSLLMPTKGAEAAVWLPSALAHWRSGAASSCAEWELLWVHLLKRLAKDGFAGRADAVAWAPIMPTLYERALLTLGLPGGNADIRPRGTAFPAEASQLLALQWSPQMALVRASARLIVLTLPPAPRPPPAETPYFGSGAELEGWIEAVGAADEEAEAAAAAKADGGSPTAAALAAWGALRQLMRSVEPYCHPSNVGGYSAAIGYLIQALAQFMSWRRLLEGGGSHAAAAGPLQPDDDGAFVRLMLPHTVLALYAKNPLLSRMAQSAAKYLGALRPELVLPALSERLADGLLAVTATHQTATAMQTLSVLAPPMLTLCPAAGEGWGAGWGAGWAGGPRAMRDLLELALPGIDANDPEKMGSTLRFVEQCLYAVPIVGREWRGGKGDTGVDAERLGLRARAALVKSLDAKGDHEGLAALEGQAEAAAELGAWLPTFAEELLGRLVAALEHQEKLPKRGWEQALLLLQWRQTSMLFFQQLSDETFAELLPRLLRLLPRTSLLDARKHVGALFSAAAFAHPEDVLARAVPVCTRALVEKGGADAKMAPLSEGEACWWIGLLAQLCRQAGAAVLPHLPALHDVLAAARGVNHREKPKVAKAAYKLQRRLLAALLSSYPSESRSLPPAAWASAEVRKAPCDAWGWAPPLGEPLGVAWHVPSEDERAAATALIDGSLGRAEALLESAAAKPPTDADVRGVLLELRAIAKGAVPFVADSAADGAGDGAAAPAALRRVELPDPEGDDFDDAHAADPDDAMDGGGVANGGANGVANGGAHGTPPPLLSVQAFAGRAALPPTLLTRLATALRRLGELLAPTEATKNLLQLLRVVRIVLSDRGPSHAMQALRQLQHFSRRTVMLRGGDRQKRLPRAMLVFKLAMRHAHRVGTTTFAVASRCAELAPLIDLQLRLCTHRYAKVRRDAQDGHTSSLKGHPWLTRAHLPRVISLISDGGAASHECKGAVIMLASSSVLRRVCNDWRLLCALAVALTNAVDHELPKLQQRIRHLFAMLCESHHAPPLQWTLAPIALDGGGGDAAADGAAQSAAAALYGRVSARAEASRREAVASLLGLLSRAAADGAAAGAEPMAVDGDATTAAPQHWSRELSAIVALMLMPRCAAPSARRRRRTSRAGCARPPPACARCRARRSAQCSRRRAPARSRCGRATASRWRSSTSTRSSAPTATRRRRRRWRRARRGPTATASTTRRTPAGAARTSTTLAAAAAAAVRRRWRSTAARPKRRRGWRGSARRPRRCSATRRTSRRCCSGS